MAGVVILRLDGCYIISLINYHKCQLYKGRHLCGMCLAGTRHVHVYYIKYYNSLTIKIGEKAVWKQRISNNMSGVYNLYIL